MKYDEGRDALSRSKLVRDNVPVKNFHIADDGEYGEALEAKLREEVDEFLESGDDEELADILEVVYALAEHRDVKDIDLLRSVKRASLGGFVQGKIWEGDE